MRRDGERRLSRAGKEPAVCLEFSLGIRTGYLPFHIGQLIASLSHALKQDTRRPNGWFAPKADGLALNQIAESGHINQGQACVRGWWWKLCVAEVAMDHAATVEICVGTASITGGASSAIASICI